MFDNKYEVFDCTVCSDRFTVSQGERRMFEARGWPLPKKCLACRRAKRQTWRCTSCKKNLDNKMLRVPYADSANVLDRGCADISHETTWTFLDKQGHNTATAQADGYHLMMFCSLDCVSDAIEKDFEEQRKTASLAEVKWRESRTRKVSEADAQAPESKSN